MAGIREMKKRVQELHIPNIIGQAMQNTNQRLIDSLRNQLLEGIAGDGKKIGKYKSKKYAAMKAMLNPMAGYGYVDVKLSGETHFEIFAIVEPLRQSVLFGSAANHEKVEKLIGQYGERIFALSVPFAKKYSTYAMTPEALRIIKKKLAGDVL